MADVANKGEGNSFQHIDDGLHRIEYVPTGLQQVGQ